MIFGKQGNFRGKRLLLVLWLSLIGAGLGAYWFHPGLFTAENLAVLLRHYGNHLILAYLFISVIRAFSLLPSTPLVIAGTLIFQDQPFTVLGISMLGILLSSTLIYYFSDFMGFSDSFDQEKVQYIRRRLEQPAGLLFVFLWAFFPAAPTDAVCYVAGSIHLRFFRFMTALMLGELLICAFYIFFGGQLMRLFA